MPADYHHGLRVIEINDGVNIINGVSTAVIGVVCTADDADADAFPLNKAVLVTDVYYAIAKAGHSGTLSNTLSTIAEQCSPSIIVVRVAEGADDAATTANLIGGMGADGKYLGMQALLSAESTLKLRPCIFAVPWLDNIDVAVELIAVAQKLRGFAYLSAYGCKNKEEAVKYREKFGQREAMVIWPDFVYWDAQTKSEKIKSAVAVAVGLRAKIDNDVGWHKTLSNVVVNGVTGVSHDVYWDLQNSDTDAGYLNSHQVTTIVNRGGFRFWGERTCSIDPTFCFENYVRSAQAVSEKMADAHFWAADLPMHPTLVRDIIAGLNAKGREWVANRYLLGFNAWFDTSVNITESLKIGKLTIDYDYTPVPPLENGMFRQRITDKYLLDFADRIKS